MTSLSGYSTPYNTLESSHPKLDQYITKIVSSFSPRNLLDLGCGNGNLAILFESQNISVTGIDESSSGIIVASGRISSAKFYNLSIYDEPPQSFHGMFDVVIAIEVLEHLFYPGKLLDYASTCLKPNGILVLSVPYYGSYIKNLICSLLGLWDSQFTVLWDGGHIKFFSLSTLRALLMDHSFMIESHFLFNRRSRLLRHAWPNNIIVAARLHTAI